MERRRHARIAFARRVIIESSRIRLKSVMMTDISVGGMLVETGPLVLPRATPLFVAFNLSYPELLDDFRLQATVVRYAPHGAGLMFVDVEPVVVRALSRAIEERGAPDALARRRGR